MNLALTVRSIRTPDLGDTSYLVVHDGIGLVVDPQRDVDRFLPPDDVELRWVFETHLHNDYVSGGPETARRTGAELVLPAGAAPAYRHTPAFHGEPLEHGRLRIVPIHTPGHTPEHTSYVLWVDDAVAAVFSGGSLLVGAAGRSDLLGPARADTLARLQYRSIHRVAALPPSAGLYPTHGEGSFCATSGAGRHTSTIGEERASNPALAHPDEERFVAAHLSGLDPFPAYYRNMGPANVAGMPPFTTGGLDRLTAEDLTRLQGPTVIDARPRTAFLAGHLPGALGIELGDSFATWTGWLYDDGPIVLVLEDDQDAHDAATRLGRIGIDEVVGVIRAGDLPDRLVVTRTATAVEVAAAAERGDQLLDVRAPSERQASAVDGSLHRYLPDLARLGPPAEMDPTRPVWVYCGSGLRSTIAAGILERHGLEPIVLDDGGSEDVHRFRAGWETACEPPLRRG